MKSSRAGSLIGSAALALTMIGSIPSTAAAGEGARVTASTVVGEDPHDTQTHARVATDGGHMVVLSGRLLTKVGLTPRRVTRLGSARTSIYASAVELHPRRPLAYVAGSTLSGGPRLQVYAVGGRAPRLVSTLAVPDRGYAESLVVTPDGDQLYVDTSTGVHRVSLARPRHPSLAQRFAMKADTVAVTPDGRHLVSAAMTYGPDRRLVEAWMGVWRLEQGRPTLERRTTLTALEFDRHHPAVQGLRVSPSGTSVYLTTGQWNRDGDDDAPAEYMVTKYRIADLTSAGQFPRVPDPKRSVRLVDLSPRGDRAYGVLRRPADSIHSDGKLVWLDRRLHRMHASRDLGMVSTAAVSRGGRTKGLVYALSTIRGKLRVSALRIG